ncbi:hypothetical protein KP509_1Z252300 [Ceratopteris richardii]|nr:hypothetical protein KP509_1Z252300 [Ceratopteris richardii]
MRSVSMLRSLCNRHIGWNTASTSIGGATSSSLMISCGTEGLLRISLAIMRICGLSNAVHTDVTNPGPHMAAPYMSTCVTKVSKSQPFVRALENMPGGTLSPSKLVLRTRVMLSRAM